MAGQIGNGQIGFDRERQVAEMATPVGVVCNRLIFLVPVRGYEKGWIMRFEGIAA